MKKYTIIILCTLVVVILFQEYNELAYSNVQCRAVIGFHETAYKFYKPTEELKDDDDALLKYLQSDEANYAIQETENAAENIMLELDNLNFIMKKTNNVYDFRISLKKTTDDTIADMKKFVDFAEKETYNEQRDLRMLRFNLGVTGEMIKDQSMRLSAELHSRGWLGKI